MMRYGGSSTLPKKDRELLTRWAFGARLKELGVEYGVTHQAVSHRMRLALERLRARWRAAEDETEGKRAVAQRRLSVDWTSRGGERILLEAAR
jgi:hypothetical protein